jgi:zinc D-Ala-D-Ala carboxypeptidase
MKSSGKKRVSSLTFLIAATAVLAALAVLCLFGSNLLYAMRINNVNELRAEAQQRNDEKAEAYAQEVADLQAQLDANNNVNQAWPEPDTQEGIAIVDLTNYALDNPGTVVVSRQDAMLGGLLLVNEWHSRPSDFDESGLVSIMTYAKSMGQTKSIWRSSEQKLFPVAISALLDALNAAKADGLEGYVVYEGYRSISDQQTLFDTEYNRLKERHSGWSEDELIASTKKSINMPGTSEYNTGLSFRLYLYESGNTELNKLAFSESDQGKWMYENSWKYGLVFRFPLQDFPTEGTVSRAYKTGVSVEMNLFRYVGVANATVMHQLDLCLEEYIEYLMAHPHIAVFEDGQLRYEIVRQQIEDETSSYMNVSVTQKTTNYTMSLDNMGGVVTVYEY